MTKSILTILMALMFFSCSTYNTVVEGEWTEEQFFKTAQQAYDNDKYSEALFFYQVYLLRYPQNHSKGIAAEYERAFVLFKQGEYDQSELYFKAILDKYQTSPYAYLYPEAYKVLSERVLANIHEEMAIKELPFFKRSKARKYGIESVLDEDKS